MILLLAAHALAGPPTTDTRFEPNQSPDQIQKILESATEEAVQSVHWTVRSFARPKLEPLATACPGYRTSVVGNTFHIQCDGKDAFQWPIGTSAPWTSPKGDSMQVTLSRSGDAFTLDFRQDEGGKKFVYDFGGEALAVTQQVYSKHLGTPMTWTLTYDRR